MDRREAHTVFLAFLKDKEAELRVPLAILHDRTRYVPQGWVFHYQSGAWVETGEPSACLVGQGPNVVLDDGTVLEGGSLDASPDDVLKRFGLAG